MFRSSCRRLFTLFVTGATLLSLAAAAAGAGPLRPRRDPPGALPPTPLHPNASAGLAMRYSGTPIDVTSYHYDNARTGWNPSETDLTPASVASQRFGLLSTLTVDGTVLAQPLLVSNYRMPDQSVHDVLVVVTAHNSVYAFDAQNYALLWQVSLGTSQSSDDVGCADHEPEYGIAATPVIVRRSSGSAVLYVVAATEPQPFEFHTRLHALSLGTGANVLPPVEIAPSARLSDGSTISYDAQNQYVRAGLVSANGSIYVSVASHCDHAAETTSGWLLRYSLALKLQASFHTIQKPAGYELATIWMSGFAPAVDSAGNLFVVTGNGSFSRNGHNWGESALRLPAALGQPSDFFTPAGFAALNAADDDFGSGGIVLLPLQPDQTAPPLAVAMGKDAVLYLMDQGNLGGIRPRDSGVLQAQRLGPPGGGLWGGPAYYAGPNGAFVYCQIDSDLLRSYAVSAGDTPSLTAAASGTSPAGFGGSTPIVSSNGAAARSGVVWLIRRAANVQLEAYDALRLGAPIFAASAGVWTNSWPNVLLTPLQANGRVYVPASGTVSVFGLTP